MPPEPRHARLTAVRAALTGDRIWLAAATTAAAADAGGGFWLSFTNLTAAAAAHGWRPPWMLALMIDLGIPTYVIADHWLVAHGHRSLFARAAVWSFAAVTVILNGAVSTDPQPLWRAAHMAAPAAWILGIEAVRRMWRAYHRGPRPASERPPLARWLASFPATSGLWRRKCALGVTWAQATRLEDARLLVTDLTAARRGEPATGAPAAPVPAAISRTIRTGWLPAGLAEAVTTRPATEWEPLVTGWAARQMALPKALLAAITAATPAASRDTPHEAAVTPRRDPPARAAVTPRRDPSRKPAQPAARQAGRDTTPDELASLARLHLGQVPAPSVNAIVKLAKDLGMPVGRPKAIQAHALLEPKPAARAR